MMSQQRNLASSDAFCRNPSEAMPYFVPSFSCVRHWRCSSACLLIESVVEWMNDVHQTQVRQLIQLYKVRTMATWLIMVLQKITCLFVNVLSLFWVFFFKWGTHQWGGVWKRSNSPGSWIETAGCTDHLKVLLSWSCGLPACFGWRCVLPAGTI